MKQTKKRTLISVLCLTALTGTIYAGVMTGYDAASTATHAATTTDTDAPVVLVKVENSDELVAVRGIRVGVGEAGDSPVGGFGHGDRTPAPSVTVTGSGGIQVGSGERPPAPSVTVTGSGGIQVGSGEPQPTPSH